MATLTVCIPTRNEASRIARAIASLAPLGARVLLADDSTDETPKIARSLGATVLRCPGMRIDECRNAAINASDTDWCLAFDADQILPAESAATILRFLASDDAHAVGAVRLPTHDATHATADPADVIVGRARMSPPWHPIVLHRRDWNGVRAFYRNPVHEVLSHWTNAHAVPTIALDAPIAHYGAVQSTRDVEFRDSRNRRLLLAWIEREPTNLDPYSYLATDAFLAGDLDEAERVLADAFRQPFTREQEHTFGRLCLTRALVACMREDRETVRTYTEVAAVIIGTHPDIDFLRGIVAEGSGDYPAALEHYMTATQREAVYSSVALAGAASWGAYERCGHVLTAMGEHADAREAYAMALAVPGDGMNDEHRARIETLLASVPCDDSPGAAAE